MEDWIKSMQMHLYERVTSPLGSAFVFSWALWNYRFLVILFSDESTSETFRLIDETHFYSHVEIFLRGFIYPLASALIFIYAYPIPAQHVYQYWKNRQKKLLEIRREIEDQTPLTIKESNQIRQEMYRQAHDARSEIESREREIQHLKDQISAMQKTGTKEISEKEEKSDSLEKNYRKITLSQAEVLRFLADKNGFAYDGQLSANDPSVRLQRDYDIGELSQIGLIRRDSDDEGSAGWSLTHDGRGYLLRESSGRA